MSAPADAKPADAAKTEAKPDDAAKPGEADKPAAPADEAKAPAAGAAAAGGEGAAADDGPASSQGISPQPADTLLQGGRRATELGMIDAVRLLPRPPANAMHVAPAPAPVRFSPPQVAVEYHSYEPSSVMSDSQATSEVSDEDLRRRSVSSVTSSVAISQLPKISDPLPAVHETHEMRYAPRGYHQNAYSSYESTPTQPSFSDSHFSHPGGHPYLDDVKDERESMSTLVSRLLPDFGGDRGESGRHGVEHDYSPRGYNTQPHYGGLSLSIAKLLPDLVHFGGKNDLRNGDGGKGYVAKEVPVTHTGGIGVHCVTMHGKRFWLDLPRDARVGDIRKAVAAEVAVDTSQVRLVVGSSHDLLHDDQQYACKLPVGALSLLHVILA
eukprot:TRINITY_DN54842_c0_g1_i1.p1 TRINITY_DN54842_c0_g1~~TRINITY_DN54842_c0_g1_i1.p1  ORF type:complete len:382 (-),score=72.23 TRINITY_DN54842_c0_g1_i1:138-1283(-)